MGSEIWGWGAGAQVPRVGWGVCSSKSREVFCVYCASFHFLEYTFLWFSQKQICYLASVYSLEIDVEDLFILTFHSFWICSFGDNVVFVSAVTGVHSNVDFVMSVFLLSSDYKGRSSNMTFSE